MKSTIQILGLGLIILGLFAPLEGFGQAVPSSCDVDETVLALYNEDAHRLALRKIIAQELDLIDTVIIPQAHVDTVLNALIAVYNAVDLPARDTVVEFLDIHTFPNPSVIAFLLAVYPSYDWVQNLSNGIIPTGQNEIDSLLTLYDLELVNYIDFSGAFAYHVAVFNAGQPLNLFALGLVFDTIPGVKYGVPEVYGGDGFDIIDTIHSDHVDLTYYFGWGDCLGGCTARRYWKFKVYFDCTVEFVGSYGSELFLVSASHASPTGFIAYPNPFTDTIMLDGINENTAFALYNMKGIEVNSGWTENGTISGLQDLSPGVYLLKLAIDDIHFFRVVKQ